MKCSAFIAASTDGFIATADGDVEWLESAGNPESGDRESIGDGGFAEYLASVDCMIMGRHCLEKIASFKLTPDQWPYGDLPIYVLSSTLSEPPPGLPGTVEIYGGEIVDLVQKLAAAGRRHAYVDGGATITSFIRESLLDEICVTQLPVLLGGGIRLFGSLPSGVRLKEASAKAYANDFVQISYRIDRG